jgi:ATP-dependent DNA helicase UvrD/PcrA
VFHADLHVHGRYSRACSKDCDIPAAAWWAARKGITVTGTGDFTHPAWSAHLKETLAEDGSGLLELRPELERDLRRALPPSCGQPARFMLTSEISTIYKYGEITRKIHHLVYAPTFAAAEAITTELAKAGNLASDGRPILGLDSRHLLEIVLNAGPGCFLVPAHIWTPWFGVLGSKSGFGTVAECYRDLAGHVFAVETGLSSDPPMNWRCPTLDGYRLMSNSDAHSPPMLGREATTFGTDVDYFAMREALRTGRGLAGTVNFFPEGGRYHLDGHRKCGIRFEPSQTAMHGGICPRCGKQLTIGVLHRVTELTGRPSGFRPADAPNAINLVSLPDIVGEIRGIGAKSKKVGAEVDRLVAALGPELRILREADVPDIARAGGALLGEAVARLRRGEVTADPGFDGEYGVIRLFSRAELAGGGALFDLAPAPLGGVLPAPRRPGTGTDGLAATGAPAPYGPAADGPTTDTPTADGQTADGQTADGQALCAPGRAGPGSNEGAVPRNGAAVRSPELDPSQREAAVALSPLMIIAGPGTGKTATLTARIAGQVAALPPGPAGALALTFTRKAAQEMRDRLAALAGPRAARVTVTTFHGLGLAILREHAGRLGLSPDFAVADDKARLAVATELAGSPAQGRRLLKAAADDPARQEEFARALAERGMADFDSLVTWPARLLAGDEALAAELRGRWPLVSVDEYQDVDAAQYELLALLAGDGSGLTVIGDPDQAIYGFRGADVGFFLRFGRDFPGAATVQLTRNYRSSPAVVAAALAAVRPSTLVPGRKLEPAPGRAGGGAPARVTLYQAADEQAEASWIAGTIDKLLGGVSLHSLDTGRADGHAGGRLGLADIAVLYRTDAQAGPLSQALTRAGLPFQKRSHDLLARRAAVPELLLALRTASGTAAPGGGPARGSGDGGVPVAQRLADAVRMLAARPAAAGAAVVDVLAAGEILAPLARRCGSDFERFLTEIALGAEADALDPRADAVSLLTLHASKGLEFGVVFLAGCERGLLPLWLPGRGGGTDEAEERRLLFVGMTRARSHLVITCTERRRRHGRVTEAGPSPFLATLDQALVSRATPPRPRRPAGRQLRLI